jgi:nicotinamide riboside kinase
LIVLVGGESTGKSTLMRSLAGALPAIEVPEALRGWVDERGRVPDAAEQWEVMAAQVANEAEGLIQAEVAGLRWVVSDGGAIMTAVYSTLYYADDTLTPAALTAAERASLIVWCDSDFPWVPDPGQRDGPETRDAAQRLIGEVLAGSRVPWLKVSGDVAVRTAEVMDHLARLGWVQA